MIAIYLIHFNLVILKRAGELVWSGDDLLGAGVLSDGFGFLKRQREWPTLREEGAAKILELAGNATTYEIERKILYLTKKNYMMANVLSINMIIT